MTLQLDGDSQRPKFRFDRYYGATNWDANPSTIQLLSDFAGTSLLNTSGGPTTTGLEQGDLIELGFFASSLGADNAIGGTGGMLIRPQLHFSGTWVPLTSKTYIGQDWSSDASGPEKIDAGDFMFISSILSILLHGVQAHTIIPPER